MSSPRRDDLFYLTWVPCLPSVPDVSSSVAGTWVQSPVLRSAFRTVTDYNVVGRALLTV